MAAPIKKVVPHLMTLADLSVPQIQATLRHSSTLKQYSRPWLEPQGSIPKKKFSKLKLPSQSLFNKTIALLFSKRSTRTRLAAETSATLLGGRALFLGKEDIQLGVNESPRDTARVIGGMCQGIFARVGEHEEIEVSYTSRSWRCSLLTQRYTGTRPSLTSTRSQRALFALAPHSNPR